MEKLIKYSLLFQPSFEVFGVDLATVDFFVADFFVPAVGVPLPVRKMKESE